MASTVLATSCLSDPNSMSSMCDVLLSVKMIKISAEYIMAEKRRMVAAPRQHCEVIILFLQMKANGSGSP
jgi:hypothetical protein